MNDVAQRPGYGEQVESKEITCIDRKYDNSSCCSK